MGIEPTRRSIEPHAGFEDQERHQAPVTSAFAIKGYGGQVRREHYPIHAGREALPPTLSADGLRSSKWSNSRRPRPPDDYCYPLITPNGEQVI